MGRRMEPRRGTAAYNLANKTVSSKKTKKPEVTVKPKVTVNASRNLIDAGTLPEMKVTAKPTNYRDVRMGRATAMQYTRSRFNRNQKNK